MADGVNPAVFRPLHPPALAHEISTPRFLYMAWRDPLTIYLEAQFREPYVYSESAIGKVMGLTDPEGIKHVLLDNFKNYDKGEFQRNVFGPLVRDGLILAEGEQWKRTRRLLAPLFTPARIAGLMERMNTVCLKRVASWPREGVVDMDHEMTGITFEIISDVLFSNMLGGESAEFEIALNAFVEDAGRISPLDFLRAPQWIPRFGKGPGQKAARFFEKRVVQLVADRRAMLANGEAPDDLLTALLNARDDDGGMSEQEVTANVLTFILAGYETTSRALGWTLHLLSRTPHYLARVRAEADAFDLAREDWQAAMPWTRAVLDEAMRLFPPAPAMMRFSLGDDVICGKAITPGTMVLISPWVIHRHRARWEDPDAFKPERFLPGAREKIDRFAYMPFSGGPRICIGASFAIQEAMIALAVILRAFDIEPTGEPEPMPQHLITLRAKDGIRLKVRAR